MKLMSYLFFIPQRSHLPLVQSCRLSLCRTRPRQPKKRLSARKRNKLKGPDGKVHTKSFMMSTNLIYENILYHPQFFTPLSCNFKHLNLTFLSNDIFYLWYFLFFIFFFFFCLVSLGVPSVKKAIGKAKVKTKGVVEGVVLSELVRMTQYQHLIDNRDLTKEMLENKG